MPLRVKTQVEPFTEYSKRLEPILAISSEYRRLYRDLERYTTGQISGRSYLIAGHRGSGKTMLVHKAIEDLLRKCQGTPQRPLFVRLHGPDLLPPLPEKSAETQDGTGNPATAAKQIAIPFSGDSSASVTASQALSETSKADAELVNVLTQMMKCLFRDVTNEFRTCFRESVLLKTTRGPRRQELLELAAQLDLEMTECPTASRLRSFWQRIGALRGGVLFHTRYEPFVLPGTPVPEIPATDVGMQEILVLSFLSQAFQVIAGKIEEKQKQTEAAKNERSSSLSTAYALKNLFAPLAGLLSGGVVGAEIAVHRNNPVAAVLLGLLTGAVVSFSFSYSSSRSRSKEMSLESVFIRDRSVATLSSVLPLLITRLRSIGLAPIFVVDELDKVQKPETRMQKLVQHLKYIVTENSFSCFLADRRYFTYLNRQANQVAYAPEYTYFSDRLLVLYQPSELRSFVKKSFETAPLSQSSQPTQRQEPTSAKAQQEKDDEDKEKIAYVLLHKARLHPIDLRRQIDRLAAKELFSIADFPAPGYRFEILAQVAIEWLLDGEDVQTQIAGNPDSRQLVYDALYYVSRLWDDASSAEIRRVPGFKDFGENADEKKAGFVLDEATFSQYIESRCAAEGQAIPSQAPVTQPATNPQPAQIKRLSGTDFDLLFLKVRELLNLLCNPGDFYELILHSPRANKPPIYILNEIPKKEAHPLLQHRGAADYQWLYDVSGRYLQTRDVNTVVGDVRAGIARIREVERKIDSLGKELGSLQAMADMKIIPRTPEWPVVQPAIDRLTPLVEETSKDPYGKMSDDRDSVVEFASTLREFEPNIKAALICAGIFAREVTVPVTSDGDLDETVQVARLSEALTQISQLLQLSTLREEDLRKLNSVLRSPYAKSTVTSDTPWDGVVEFVRSSMKRTDKIDPAPIVDSAWNICKNRFTQRFRDSGTQSEPQFEDVFTSLRDVGPGRVLSANLSTITAAAWTQLLLHSLLQDAIVKVPEWMRVAASVELCLLDLAEKLAKTLASDYILLSQWVRDARLHLLLPNVLRRNVLVLTAEKRSMTEGWQPSKRHAALVSSATDFVSLIGCLRKQDIFRPIDFPFDSVCIELSDDRRALSMLRPATVIAAMLPSKAASKIGPTIPKELESFANMTYMYYFTQEAAPTSPSETASQSALPVVAAPKGLDDLIDRSSGTTGRAASA